MPFDEYLKSKGMHGKKDDSDEEKSEKKPKGRKELMAEIGEHAYEMMLLCKKVKEEEEDDDDADRE